MKRWIVGLLVLGLPGCFNSLLITPTNVNAPLEESMVQEAKGWTTSKVALIEVSGLIVNARKPGLLGDGENPVSVFREKLELAAEDDRVKAVVLRINSPGGGVTASDIMYHDLLAFREKTNKPVVACMMDVAASGGYYLAMGCDCVYAHPSTTTGSIGVIMNLYNAKDLFDKIGIESDPIKSGPNKDLLNPARKLSEEERAILQNMVDQFYDRFVEVVAKGRGLSEQEVGEIADGRVYSAIEARQLRLIDEIGYLEDAIKEARARAGVKDAAIIAYDRGPEGRGTIYAAAPRIPSEIQLKVQVPGFQALQGAGTFLYLWQPGLGTE
jgi:protease-4